MIAQKFTESVADVMRYIVNVEMGGEIDKGHSAYGTYCDLRHMFSQVKSHNEKLDLQTHCVLRDEYSFEEDRDKYYNHPDEVFNRKWREDNIR